MTTGVGNHVAMQRRLVLVLLAVVLSLGITAVAPAPVAVAQEVTSTTQLPESGGIIPRPNSGTAPEDAGDRGGALQTALFFLVMGGVGVIGVLVVRESRKKRAARGF